MRPRRKFVNQARQNFLASPAFTQQQHGNIDVRNQSSLRANFLHRRTRCHEENVVAQLFNFPGVGLALGACRRTG